jgi:Amt family ammonium transporter
MIDTGDTAWILTSTALVLFMTLPGLALFYGGLVQSKNILSVLMQCIAIACLASVTWFVVAYSLAFTEGNAWVGGLSQFLLIGMARDTVVANTGIPESLFFMFQMTFAIITPALMVGAFVERIRFSAVLMITALWLILVYAPVTHWVWGGGWLADMGAWDFAGGTVVHVNAAAAALVAAVVVGKRVDYRTSSILPHNVPFVLLGSGLLWFGWFGFNAGSALAASPIAGLAFVTTMLAPAATLVVWTFLDMMRSGKPTAVGCATAIVVGLVAVTPAAGFISPMNALLLGGIAAVPSYFALVLRARTSLDDSLDVVAAHGVGGTVGALLTGVFAEQSLNGLFDGAIAGNPGQVLIQGVAVLTAMVYSGVVSFILLKLISLFIPLRAKATEEMEGLDISAHGEEAYMQIGGSSAIRHEKTMPVPGLSTARADA